MIDLGADVILALAPRESADLTTDLHYACAAQIPVRQVHSQDSPSPEARGRDI